MHSLWEWPCPFGGVTFNKSNALVILHNGTIVPSKITCAPLGGQNHKNQKDMDRKKNFTSFRSFSIHVFLPSYQNHKNKECAFTRFSKPLGFIEKRNAPLRGHLQPPWAGAFGTAPNHSEKWITSHLNSYSWIANSYSSRGWNSVFVFRLPSLFFWS